MKKAKERRLDKAYEQGVEDGGAEALYELTRLRSELEEARRDYAQHIADENAEAWRQERNQGLEDWHVLRSARDIAVGLARRVGRFDATHIDFDFVNWLTATIETALTAAEREARLDEVRAAIQAVCGHCQAGKTKFGRYDDGRLYHVPEGYCASTPLHSRRAQLEAEG